ncbi:uncharacterized protein TNCV_2996821 [Trichonephila clavipes]|nr:uncharacterized protein TNCV_2996821 [Trichonephila clavipes]
MTSCNHMCDHSCNGSQEPYFKRQYSASHGKGVTKLSPHCFFPCLACPIPRFISNRAYLGSFGMASWASHKFDELEARLQQVLNEMSQDIIQNLYASMPDRIASCIRARRGSTGNDNVCKPLSLCKMDPHIEHQVKVPLSANFGDNRDYSDIFQMHGLLAHPT